MMINHEPSQYWHNSSTTRETLSEFGKKMIAHPKLMDVVDTVFSTLGHDDGYSVIMMYGPTGVGKSKVLTHIKNMMIKKYSESLIRNPGHVPVAYVECDTPSCGKFDWKYHYIECLRALDEPLPYEKKIVKPLFDNNPEQLSFLKSKLKRNPSYSELKDVLIHVLKERSPLLFIYDEAQNILKIPSGGKVLNQADNIKSIANKSKVKHMLSGPYELLDFVGLNGQLTRRILEIHFPRYRYENDEDMRSYQGILNTFEKVIPTVEPTILSAYFDLLYEWSLGCVGILKDWLYQCLEYCLERNEPIITPKILEKYAHSKSSLQRIAIDIFEGERRLEEDNSFDLSDALKMRTKVYVNRSAESAGGDVKKSHRRPGERKPSRDIVGGGLQ